MMSRIICMEITVIMQRFQLKNSMSCNSYYYSYREHESNSMLALKYLDVKIILKGIFYMN